MRPFLIAACVAVTSTPAIAQIDMRSAGEKAAPRTWNVTVGASVGAGPSYFGSNRYSASVSPIFSFQRGVGSRWLSVADDNIAFGLIGGQNWRAGFTGKFLGERRESRDFALRGLGNVGFGAEIGGFAEYYPLPWLRARAELRRGFAAHEALVGDLKLDFFTRFDDRWTVSIGPRVTLAGRDFTQTYLGVNAAQSARSGLPQFRAGDGILSYGLHAQVTYQWTPRFETSLFVEATRLAGDAARSPLIRQRGSENQVTVGTSLRWTIDTGM
ncbi:MAG: hypothetical protein CTY25_02045 [Methylobacterium sp.]|nr:MAG: hypothetical protein CTY25_02045 [Methylobacterium sp.]